MILEHRADMKRLLETTRTIAVVGLSPKEDRASNFVSRYLQREGYRVIPVNPVYEGQLLLGEHCYGSLAQVPEPIDLVDIFQRSENVPPRLNRPSPATPRRSGCKRALSIGRPPQQLVPPDLLS